MAVRDVLLLLLEKGIDVDPVTPSPPLPEDAHAMLVYGSRARGDALPESDLDLLVVVETHRPSDVYGRVSVSYYTIEQLMTGTGTLFGSHLQRDGVIIFDDRGELADALEAMGPVDPSRVLDRARAMSTLFTTPHTDMPKYLPGLAREARYLLRSCLYAQAIAAGSPSFSVRGLAQRHNDPTLATLLASRQEGDATLADYERCLDKLRAIIGEFPRNHHGSLEATIVNEWGHPSDVLSMAMMAIGSTGADPVDYAEVEKILL